MLYFWAFQNQRSLRYRTQGVIMLSRARYCWPGSNYPVTQHDCSPGPPPSAASAAEASLLVPWSPRASFLSGMRPVPRSRPHLSRCAASDIGLSSWTYAADFGALVEKSSLKKRPWSILPSQKHLILHDLKRTVAIKPARYPGVQAGGPENTIFFASISICHAITDPPVSKIRLWASFGV